MDRSPLEQQRLLHEECERLEDAMAEELIATGRTEREKILSDHRVKSLLQRHVKVSTKLKAAYDDEDGERAREVASFSAGDPFSTFYSRLSQVRAYHKNIPSTVAMPMSIEVEQIKTGKNGPAIRPLVEFSGEEGNGRYLDMIDLHTQFINLKEARTTLSYYEYVSKEFDRLFDYPRQHKHSGAYRTYLSNLLEYLTGFHGRLHPLYDLEADLSKVNDEFLAAWHEGTFVGWPKKQQPAAAAAAAKPIKLNAYKSAQDLEKLSMDELKAGLMALGLKCGGTLKQRAERLFSTKGKSKKEFDPAILASKKRKREKNTDELDQTLAAMEAKVYRMTELLATIRKATTSNVERKQSRTAQELEEEDEEMADKLYSSEEDDDDDDEASYVNSKVQYDQYGKPIPYWLFKLHGLNFTFKCEICGNATYRGPKAFQQHFSEWCHAHHMRILGIPNTLHFHNVTKIEEAKALWAKLQEAKEAKQFHADEDEEFEDSAGNVFNKKTFEDLRRQGLL